MNRVDERLQRASAETRRLVENRLPPGIAPKPQTSVRGWVVVGGAFATVILAFGLIPWLLGTSEPAPVGGSGPLSQPGTTTAIDGTGVEQCSVTGVELPGPANGVPAAVSEMREELIAAASICDLDRLTELAAPGFTTSFGGGGAEDLIHWEEDGGGRLEVLLAILAMSHGVVETGEGQTIYVWPAAFAYDDWDAIPAELLTELEEIYTTAELADLSQLGVYGGWRTGIDDAGNWLFFVAGD